MSSHTGKHPAWGRCFPKPISPLLLPLFSSPGCPAPSGAKFPSSASLTEEATLFFLVPGSWQPVSRGSNLNPPVVLRAFRMKTWTSPWPEGSCGSAPPTSPTWLRGRSTCLGLWALGTFFQVPKPTKFLPSLPLREPHLCPGSPLSLAGTHLLL